MFRNRPGILAAIAAVMLVPSLPDIAHAATLSGFMTGDDVFSLYLSTSDSEQGTLLLSGNDWNQTYTLDPVALASGHVYYLHVVLENTGDASGFLGSFSINGDFAFSNQTRSLVTGSSGWLWSTLDQAGALPPDMFPPVVEAFSAGQNGVGPWGLRPLISPDAFWMVGFNSWDPGYFTFSSGPILEVPPEELPPPGDDDPPASSTPEPATSAMIGSILAALPWFIRRTKSGETDNRPA